MSDSSTSSSKRTRRSLLGVMAGTAGYSFTGLSVSARKSNPTFAQLLEKSHKILENVGVQKQHKFLRKNGVSTALESISGSFPPQAQDGISTQNITTGEIQLWFSLFKDCDGRLPDGTFTAEFTWEYGDNASPYGINPMDYAGIGWDENTWYYETNNKDDIYTSSDSISFVDGSSGEGPLFKLDDEQLVFNSENTYYVGTQLTWNGTEDEKSNRTLAASYEHTWDSVKITGLGVSYPEGATITVGDETNSWNYGRDQDGNFLRLRYDQADGCY